MKPKRKMFLKKRFYLLLLILFLLVLIIGIFLGSIYFSSTRVKNFPVGDNTAQINFTPGGINIFYPKDDTTFYYSHNFSWPQQITGVNTKLSDPNATLEHKSFLTSLTSWISSFSTKPESKSAHQPDTSKSSDSGPQQTKQLQPSPQTEQHFTSKLLDLNLTTPKGFTMEIDRGKDFEVVKIDKDHENQMSLTIFPVAQGCKDTDYSSGRFDPLRIKIGGKYQVTFTHSSISHGDVGHYYSAQALATNDYCIAAGMNIDVQNQREFTNILEGK